MTIETKYNIGDEVWFTHDHIAMIGKVDKIEITTRFGDVEISYEVDVSYMTLTEVGKIWEGFLFPTKEELLKSL